MFTITTIQKSDNTKEFDCGNIELNLFFQKYAKQNQYKHYIGTTYILRYKGELAGYVSVSSGSIKDCQTIPYLS